MPEDEVPKEFLEGFNKGYTIAEAMPELADQLKQATGKSLQLEGLKEGIEQYNLEKNKEQLLPWLKKDRLSSLNKDTEKSKDKESPDKE